ncbi:gamma-glutamyltranspeptidase [Methylomicrobium album BG8]|uniref:Glutathione hydrolase proenzyme n=2 Tax=Methylomicrobium album TaxID=39775 RepID=H8GR13_METAL|nr:gamma-glutamyltranspeptidase [Methylomicrobium album BG8]
MTNRMLKPKRRACLYACLLCVAAPLRANPSSEPQAAIASAHPLATRAGFEILAKGGNVFDAAVAVSAALAVVEPSSSGLGGGGYWLLHRASDGFETMIDGREKAPYAAHQDMFRNRPNVSTDGALAAAIPGLPAGLAHLAERYGRLPLAVSLAPAIRHAENGFAVGHKFHKLLASRQPVIRRFPAASRIFLPKGKLPEPFSILRQPDLAETLKRIARSGRDGFYRGKVAEKLVDSVRATGGIWTETDLASYRIVERRPVKGEYRSIKITSAAPSSSGGIVLIEALNVLSGYDLQKADETARTHLIVEAMRRAYHDRALYLGDPDYVHLPVERLLDADYAAGLRSTIRFDKALPSAMLTGEPEQNAEAANTTHFSIIDRDGNRVAATLSINLPFGSGFVAAGTGVLLNDEMDDFASGPGTGNAFGLIGGAANAIQPGKRMLSSMTPTFLENERGVAVLGTPGGSRIISMVLLAALDYAEGHDPDSWVSLPRFHHQYLPDAIQFEPDALSRAELDALAAKGHRLTALTERYGDMQAALWNKKTRALSAGSDPRGEGLALVGP